MGWPSLGQGWGWLGRHGQTMRSITPLRVVKQRAHQARVSTCRLQHTPSHHCKYIPPHGASNPSAITNSTSVPLQLSHLHPTWQPTPTNSRRLTSSASTVASTLRFGDSVGFTPLAARMSSRLRATTCGSEMLGRWHFRVSGSQPENRNCMQAGQLQRGSGICVGDMAATGRHRLLEWLVGRKGTAPALISVRARFTEMHPPSSQQPAALQGCMGPPKSPRWWGCPQVAPRRTAAACLVFLLYNRCGPCTRAGAELPAADCVARNLPSRYQNPSTRCVA